MNRKKNIEVLFILTMTLLFVKLIPVTCFFKYVTGISCPTCGMTRAFISILHFDLSAAFSYNILSIPLFIFIFYTICILVYEIITDKYTYIPKLLKIFSNKIFLISLFFFLLLSFFINNVVIVNP